MLTLIRLRLGSVACLFCARRLLLPENLALLLLVGLFLVNDSGDCIIHTSGLPDPIWYFSFILINGRYAREGRPWVFP